MADYPNDMVTIDLIGADGEWRFAVHRNILCSTSTYFRTCLKPEWLDSRTDSHNIKMRDVDPGAMERWIGWSYTRRISLDLAAREKCANAEQIANHVQNLFTTLAHDVKFSDRILDI
ncbi:hypothetical protein J1614_001909 [Plenodomus biglobosus]|nr:hypothetical protein J1614_001909 [Plenodomus biglobosus]